MNGSHLQGGYAFLIAVIVIGAIALAVTGSLLLLSVSAGRNALTVERSARAFSFARTCAEHALLKLSEGTGYIGNEDLVYPEGSCSILTVGGSGNENRTLCVEGEAGGVVRRIEILLQRVLPSVRVYSTREVDIFTSCSA